MANVSIRAEHLHWIRGQPLVTRRQPEPASHRLLVPRQAKGFGGA